MRILIVDDDLISRQALKKILETIGQCDMASSGFEALNAFRLSYFSNKLYDLITLDFLMPDLNGPRLLSRIRKIEERIGIPKSKQVKVLMVTVQSDKDSVMESASAGCQDYIIKPFDPQTVLKKVKKLGIPVPIEEETQVDISDLKGIFIHELGNRINRIKESIEKSNINTIQLVAHQLHGTGSSYGFFEVTQIGAQIEEAAKKGDWTRIKHGFETLTNLYQEYKMSSESSE